MRSATSERPKAGDKSQRASASAATTVDVLTAYFIHSMVNVAHGDIDNVATFGHGAFHAVWLGLLVSTPVLATNALFEQRSFKYIAINAGYWIVCFAIMGGIIKVWQ